MLLKVCLHTWSLYRAENWSIFSIINKVTENHNACMSQNENVQPLRASVNDQVHHWLFFVFCFKYITDV